MGKVSRQFNQIKGTCKNKLKKPIRNILALMESGFTDFDFVNTFSRLYPHLWDDLEKQYVYWQFQNKSLQKYGKKRRYNFPKPSAFVLECSYTDRKNLRKAKTHISITETARMALEAEIMADSAKRMKRKQDRVFDKLHYIQEIEPRYAQAFINRYFKTHNLHERLEIIRELSKYKSERIISFFYAVNASTRNFSLKEESMRYIQGLGLPFYLRAKKKGKKTFIDNEIVVNNSSPEVLHQRLFSSELERLKVFDVFISHNSKDEHEIIDFFKSLNAIGYVAYIDWVNDKFDLKREWCNATTATVIRERIKQSKVFVFYLSQQALMSQWCPWELGYADALGKKICIFYKIEEAGYIPEFYTSYPELIIEGNPMVKTNDGVIPFEQWICS